MRLVVLVAATTVLALSCSYANPATRVSPAASHATTVAGGELRCRLPVSSSATPGTAGFITFPGGTFSVDPASNPTLPGHSDSSYVNNYTYDFNRSRWLPTSWRAVGRDGSIYAYWDGMAVHVFDLNFGRDSSLGAPPAWDHLMQPPSIFAVTQEGVYAQAGSPGLWLIGSSGTQRQVTKEGYWDAVANGAGWGRPTNSYPGAGAVYSILRLDLRTGVSEPWFTQAGVLEVVGVDFDGNPIVMVAPKTGPDRAYFELWLVTGRDHGTRIFASPSDLTLVIPVIGDSHGIWFVAFPKLYLYSKQLGVQEMASARVGLAGGCG
jgi:hypothetical protein